MQFLAIQLRLGCRSGQDCLFGGISVEVICSDRPSMEVMIKSVVVLVTSGSADVIRYAEVVTYGSMFVE